MLADFIEGSGTLPSPLPRAWVRVRNLLDTLASLDEVASRPLYTVDDDGMCPADYGHELAAELGNACLSSVQLQYAWSALERLLKFVSPAKPIAAKSLAEIKFASCVEGLALPLHADCSVRYLTQNVPELFKANALPVPALSGVDDLIDFRSGGAVALARLMRNKIFHGEIVEAEPEDSGGQAGFQARVVRESARACLFAIQMLFMHESRSRDLRIPVDGRWLSRDCVYADPPQHYARLPVLTPTADLDDGVANAASAWMHR